MAMKTKSLPEKAISWDNLFPFSFFWVWYNLMLVIRAQVEKHPALERRI